MCIYVLRLSPKEMSSANRFQILDKFVFPFP